MLTFILTALAAAVQPADAPVQATQLPPPQPVPTVQAPPLVAVADTRPYVELVTEAGRIVLRLEDKRAPVTAANFLRYVDTKRMDGFVFYRTTRSWGPANRLVQGGNKGDPRRNYAPIAHEPTNITGLTHCKGAVSMARSRPGDAGSDFFLILTDIPGFDANPSREGDNVGYAAFGEMISGAEATEKIFEAPVSATTGEGVMAGQILEKPVKIISARRIPAPADAPQGCVVKAAP